MEANSLGHFVCVYEKFAQAENKSERTIEAVTGAATVYIPGDEVYTALSLGTVEAATWGGTNSFWTWKWYEAAKYIIFPGPNVRLIANDIIVNPDAWNSLPDDLKAVLKYVTEGFCRNFCQVEIRENNKATESMVNDYGVTVIQMPEEDYPIFTAAAEGIWADMAEEHKGDAEAIEILKLITDYLRAQGYTDFKIE